jgi:hypothetical protein
MLIRILAGHIYLGTLLGGNVLALLQSPQIFCFFVFVAVIGTAIVALCFVKSSVEMKLFLLFSIFIFAASLYSPTAYPPPGVSMWQLLAGAASIRYWYFPTLAFAWSILWCSRSRLPLLRIAAACLLLVICIGIVRDWRHPAYEDMHFAEYAKRLDAAPAGAIVTIPENPKGWNVQLIKHN